MRIRATRSLARKPHQIPHVPIIPSWCRGSRRHVSRRRAATTEQHSCLPAGRRGGSARLSRGQEKERTEQRCRGGEATRAPPRGRPAECSVDRDRGAHPDLRLTSPGQGRGQATWPRGCDHGGAPPYTEAPCSARRRPAAPPPAGPACLYPSPPAFIASACMPTAHTPYPAPGKASLHVQDRSSISG